MQSTGYTLPELYYAVQVRRACEKKSKEDNKEKQEKGRKQDENREHEANQTYQAVRRKTVDCDRLPALVSVLLRDNLTSVTSAVV